MRPAHEGAEDGVNDSTSVADPLALALSLPTWMEPAPVPLLPVPARALLSRRTVLAGASGVASWVLAGSWQGRVQRQVPVVEVRPVAPSLPPPPVVVASPHPAPATPPPPAATALTYIRRAEWGGTAPETNCQALGRVHRLTIHHTGADSRALGASDWQTVQRIEDYHRNHRGWACIGYHFLIGADGAIYEGRPLSLQGAHVMDQNQGNLGIACIGAFDAELPESAQLRSLARLVEALRERLHLPVTAIHGHRDLSPSTCPGDALYAWMQERWFGPARG